MKRIKFFIGLSLLMGAVVVLASCGAAGSAKKAKGIVLQEGDRATVTDEDGFTTIAFPAELTEEDVALYDTDLLGYLYKANAPITSDGNEYDIYRIYYYLHNSKEWLHKGTYDRPYELTVSKIASVRIADDRMRLREFYEQMPLLHNSQEKKSDTSYQNEIRQGDNYYIFIDITLRD